MWGHHGPSDPALVVLLAVISVIQRKVPIVNWFVWYGLIPT